MAWDWLARVLLAAALVAVTLLAGCGGFVAGDGASDADGPLTPVPVPTDAAAYPPGVSGSGVTVATLTAAHGRELAATNYTLVSRQRIVDPNGTLLRTTNRTRAVGAGGTAYAGSFNRTVIDFPVGTIPATLEYWTNGSVYATRRFIAGSPEFYGWSRRGQPTEDVDDSQVVGRVVRALDVSVIDREGGGVTLVSTDLRRPDPFPNPPYLTGPRNVSFTAAVTADGVAVRWRLAYDATVEGRTVRVIRVTRITDVGRTTVDRPDWIDTAREWERSHQPR